MISKGSVSGACIFVIGVLFGLGKIGFLAVICAVAVALLVIFGAWPVAYGFLGGYAYENDQKYTKRQEKCVEQVQFNSEP